MYKNIKIKGVKVHNLNNISLDIPQNNLVVITGLSGSGKSSLAFDTLYAEGQRRYVESLSSYARQFLGRLDKPEVDYIKGIPPAIAIEQKVISNNPRSTVGTSTEIYDYLKLLYARIGKTFSPISNTQVIKHDVKDVVDYVWNFGEGTKVLLLAPIKISKDRNLLQQLKIFQEQGFSRLELDGKILKINELNDEVKTKNINLLIDRINVSGEQDNLSRFSESVQIAFYEGKDTCIVKILRNNKVLAKNFTNSFEADGIKFADPNIHMFTFNNPIGTCPTCNGFGKTIGIDEDLVIPNKNLSIYEEAIACWKGEKMSKWKDRLITHANKFTFPIHKPYNQLAKNQKQLLWDGNQYFEGLHAFFSTLENESYKIQFRIMLARYRGKTTCPECNGGRLRTDSGYVKIEGKSIQDLVSLPIIKLKNFFRNLNITEHEQIISKRLLIEIKNRINFLCDVGLGYLNLNRESSSLSGGESQRINLATSLGSSLVGSLYILDEPSIGLHPRDTYLLIKILHKLKQLGNTVIVVEHDEEIIKSADLIIDIGPYAGVNGGEIVFQGTQKELLKSSKSLTTKYLTGQKQIPIPEQRKKLNKYIEVIGACENNLKNINVKFFLNSLVVVTGVSGSGKSSLVKGILFPALQKHLGKYGEKIGKYDIIKGNIDSIHSIEFVDQNPIGKSSRSNPATYLKVYDEIRKLFAHQQLAKQLDFKPSHFSFNIEGGRCDECHGDGVIKVDMQFMADIYLTCETCKGQRFKHDILEIKYKNKNIYNILELTIDEALVFFNETKNKKLLQRLKSLQEVGLGYIKLGQSSNTLSGGESQRIKLATFIAKEKSAPSLFIFDEPTTGLHFHDIKKLLSSFNALIQEGHSIIVVEHNLEIIKSADHIIDLGPEGGEQGGQIMFEGTPEDIMKCKKSYTGQFLKEKL